MNLDVWNLTTLLILKPLFENSVTGLKEMGKEYMQITLILVKL